MKTTKLIPMFVMFLLAATLVFAFPISGTVSATGSGVLANANITVYNVATGTIINTTTSASDGTYTADSVGAGLKIINATHAGYNTQSIPRFVSGPVTVNFGLGPIPSYVLSGTGTPAIAGINIKLMQGATVVAETNTSATGTYSVNLLNGTYSFEASAPGYRTYTATVIMAGNTLQNFVLTPSVTTGTVSGYVKDSVGTVLSGANVRLTMNGGTVAQDDTDAAGFYTITYNQGSYNATASYTGLNAGRTPVNVVLGSNSAVNFTLTSPGTTCTPNWQWSAWSTCSGGSQTRTPTVDLNSCGTAAPASQTQSCGSSSSGSSSGGGGYSTSNNNMLSGLVITGRNVIWDMTSNPLVKTIRPIDTIIFTYEKTSFNLIVDKFDKDTGLIGFRMSPTDEVGSGYKNDQFVFHIKDKVLIVTPQEINVDPLVDSKTTISLRLYLTDGPPKKTVVETVTETVQKAANGVIKVAGEVTSKQNSVPVGIGISVATIVVGLMLFLGIRKIWR